jgi:general secretion pathway protein H
MGYTINFQLQRPWFQQQQALKKQHGFTLLELLVVVVIAAILFTYTTLAIRTDSPADIIKKEAQRFERLVQLALEEAILRGEEYALEINIDGYRFLRFSEEELWLPISNDRILRTRQLPQDMELELQLEYTEIVIELAVDTDDESLTAESEDDEENKTSKIIPQVYLLSSGEITPEFAVRFYILGVETSYDVKAQFDGSLTTEISEL